jgi:hypothetical protein
VSRKHAQVQLASSRASAAGATGATGREVVAQLLARPTTWQTVVTLGRRRVEDVPAGHEGVNLTEAEQAKRLVQEARTVARGASRDAGR